jgi:6-phosphogluconolactonase
VAQPRISHRAGGFDAVLNSRLGFHAYVSNAESKTISVFRLTQDRDLERIEEIAVPGTSEPSPSSMPLAVSPDRRFLYAALRTPPFPVSTFRIDPENGRLTRLATAPLPHSTPFITTDNTGQYLLSASYHGGSIAVNAINTSGLDHRT